MSSRSTGSALDPVELNLEQLGGPGGDRVEVAPRVVQPTSPAIRTVVSGVRSSWETSETNRRCTRLGFLELPDLALEVRRPSG